MEFMYHIFIFFGSKRWNLILDMAVLIGICIYCFCLFSTIDTTTVTSERLEAANKYAYFVIAQNGDLVCWGANDVLSHTINDIFSYPYIARRTILKHARTVSVGDGATMAIDEDGTLWGWGNRSILLSDKKSTLSSPTLIMRDVRQVATELNYVAVVKTDSSLWLWNSSYEPKKVMDDVNYCFLCAGALFVVDSNDNLYFWNAVSDLLNVGKANKEKYLVTHDISVKEISYAYSYCFQCLTKSGDVYLLDQVEDYSKISVNGPVYRNVDSLCDRGFVTQDGELMIWKWGESRIQIARLRERIRM